MTGDTINFTIGDSDNFGSDPVTFNATIEDIGDNLKFTVNVVLETNMENIADLRGIFIDIADESLLEDLSVSGEDVSDSIFKANNVINLEDGNNLNGGTNKFDIGFEFGTSGIALFYQSGQGKIKKQA